MATADVLAEKRELLERQIAELMVPPEPGSIGFGKRVGDGTSQAVERITAVSAHDHLTGLLAEVTRAEAKLDDGTYGRCDVCGEPIAPARLEARPWATHCVTHA